MYGIASSAARLSRAGPRIRNCWGKLRAGHAIVADAVIRGGRLRTIGMTSRVRLPSGYEKQVSTGLDPPRGMGERQ